MKVICSWCGKVIKDDERDTTGDSDDIVTHAICPECDKSMKSKRPKGRPWDWPSQAEDDRLKGEHYGRQKN